MRRAILLIVALVAVGGALVDCDLNPQPHPPGEANTPSGMGGGSSGSGSGGLVSSGTDAAIGASAADAGEVLGVDAAVVADSAPSPNDLGRDGSSGAE
ncbi:MAG: hypothetical protein M3O46_06330, partial [Myxococcota bacterium]|nr:hypothetical protein [Myxococcota bacterium]